MSIPGAPPRLDRPIVGCPFEPRCDRAFDPLQGPDAGAADRSAPNTRRRVTSTTPSYERPGDLVAR